MPTWDEYKAYVKNNNPEIGVDIEDAERVSAKYKERFYQQAEQYYCLALDDYSLPGYISGSKDYFGILEQIETLIMSLNREFKDTKEAFQAFKSGKTNAEHYVTHEKRRLLVPVELIRKETFTIEQHAWEHTNVWDCIYLMKADKIVVEQALICYGEKYIRAIRPVFTNLRYADEMWEAQGYRDVGMFWGFPNMLTLEGDEIRCSLLIGLHEYDTLEEAVAAMDDLEYVDFTNVIEEVFGDG